MDRNEIRAKVLASPQLTGTKIDFFGAEIEVRAPSVGDIEAYGRVSDGKIPFTKILINHAYVPGTNEKVFEEADTEMLRQLPFTGQMQVLVDAIQKFTNLGIEDAEKN